MREIPFTRRQIAVATACVLIALFVVSRALGRHSSAVAPPIPTATSPQAAATTSAATIVVDVAGAVRRPGLYRLTGRPRVADAVARAGGATPAAQLELVNLAALVSDGEQIVVPRRGQATAVAGGSPAPVASGPVHLNSATAEQLDTLPGVGPVTAQKIIEYRTQHGAFGSLEELDAIPGIGPARLEQLKGVAAP